MTGHPRTYDRAACGEPPGRIKGQNDAALIILIDIRLHRGLSA